MQILLNVVTLMHVGWQKAVYPGCFLASPSSLIKTAVNLGYDGVMMLPIHGADGNETNVYYYEDAWSSMPDGGFWPYLMRRRELRSCIIQWLVSPGITKCHKITDTWEKAKIPKIVHIFDANLAHIMEIHIDLNCNIREIADASNRRQKKLCLDTSHWLEMGLGLNDITTIAPYVGVVHLNPHDVHLYLKDEAERQRHLELISELEQRAGRKHDIVVEYNPGMRAFLDPNYGRSLAERMFNSIPN